MSKRKQLSGGVERRTQGSAYDGDNGLSLGDDFLSELEEAQGNPELKARYERLKQEIADYEEKAIVPADDSTLLFRGLKMTTRGIDESDIPDDLDEEAWVEVVSQLRVVDEAVQWAVGDLMRHAIHRWGEKYEYYAERTGYAEKTLREYAYVARSVPVSIRMDKLSFGHHQLVAGFKDAAGQPLLDVQQEWLERAVHGDHGDTWSVARLRKEIARSKRSGKQLKSSNVDSALHAKNLRKLVKLLNRDVSRLSTDDVEKHLDNIRVIKSLLKQVESKLKKAKRQA